ncbi:hypothetical protein [Providencia manganoxydans]|uniref:hypothetical protein n=1 Tax=Providencia manganoxydans TaxID=2923283 RepID=UPI0029C0D4A9|nr:hypothetical protein [Providencia manganoxydans]MDX4947168.1 hypothetical protein [Providencia manganoxydans]
MSTYFHLSCTVNVEDQSYSDQVASLESGIRQAFENDSCNFSNIAELDDERDIKINGTFNPTGSTSDERKRDAKRLIRSVFSGLMNELEIPSTAITINCTVIARTINEPFQFTV